MSSVQTDPNPRGEPSPSAELRHGPGTVLSRTMYMVCMTNISVAIILLHFTKEEITVTAHPLSRDNVAGTCYVRT